jgi:lipopolysaccharide/colanic/teichoic acid biosynthesis glycosyltransferase
MTASSENGRVRTEFAPDAVSVPTDMALPEQFAPVHVVPLGDGQIGPPGSWAADAIYRLFELAAALLLLILASPVMLLLAILIRIDTPGPVLFRQPRVARSAVLPGRALDGRTRLIPPPGGFEPDTLYLVPQTFLFLKFRTMHYDARVRWPELYEYRFDPATFRDRTFKTDHDPRVTGLGLVLRRLTLDELPNLWCVLMGTMRLVGPRPELPELPQNYDPNEMYKFAVKPGVTGLAQINGRGLLSWGETLAWDLEYVRTRTVMLDLKILFLTSWYVLVRRGAF